MNSQRIPAMFRDRREAGRLLGERLAELKLDRPVVLALPRGGVPVADEVARELKAPMDVLLVRKLGVPHNPEFAFGAIGEDGARVVNAGVVRQLRISADDITQVESRERRELLRRVKQYRDDAPPMAITGRTVVIVDDGLATGATALVAVDIARRRGAGTVIVAVPVAPPETVDKLSSVADEVISLLIPGAFRAVGEWYVHFDQTTDEEVTSLLRKAAARASDAPGSEEP